MARVAPGAAAPALPRRQRYPLRPVSGLSSTHRRHRRAGGRGRVALVALLPAAIVLGRSRCGALRADQRVVLGDGAARRTSSPTRPGSQQRVRGAARLRRGRRRARSTSGWTTAEHRLDGAIAYRALVRYDAYGEMSGHQSTSIALLDAAPQRRRALVDPPPRPGARCT